MASTLSTDAAASGLVSPARWLVPLSALIFLGFLTVGLPLAVLPSQIHGVLGFGATVVGIAMGAQSLATLLMRPFAGTMADAEGARGTVLKGLFACALTGVVYLVSLWCSAMPIISLFVLIAGRILLGLGESMLITAAMAWGIGLTGPQNSARVIAWSGIAIYGAMAVGAPLGVVVNDAFGFAGVSVAASLVALLAVPFIVMLRPVAPSAQHRLPFYRVLGLVWLPGLGVAMATAGFAMLVAFVTLLFAEQRWANAAWALTLFGAGYIIVRLLFAGLPDRLGGTRVAVVSLAVEALGQVLLWHAADPTTAFVGAALTGGGYSLVLPSFGVEVIRRTPPQSRGSALGAFVAFWDLTMGIAAPIGGIFAAATGYSTVFLIGFCAAIMGIMVACILHSLQGSRSV